jgi:uncharacterized membrane protein
MGKASRQKKTGRKEAVRQIPMRAVANWPLLGLALVGIALTAYLTAATWRGQALAGCPAGSGCDVVLSSRWSEIFGLPTSFWGFFTYAALGAVAFIKAAESRWKIAWTISLFGVLFSLYLTAVSLIQLDAACPYCLASLVLMIVILGVGAYQRPGDLPGFTWRRWLVRAVPGPLIAVLVLHLHFAGVLGTPTAPEDPSAHALAEHLVKTNAKFYGASWCPHCMEQKELFGASAHRLPYVECSPQGRRGPEAPQCRTAGIKVYPTWIIEGRSYEGVLSFKQLADLSRFRGVF